MATISPQKRRPKIPARPQVLPPPPEEQPPRYWRLEIKEPNTPWRPYGRVRSEALAAEIRERRFHEGYYVRIWCPDKTLLLA